MEIGKGKGEGDEYERGKEEKRGDGKMEDGRTRGTNTRE